MAWWIFVALPELLHLPARSVSSLLHITCSKGREQSSEEWISHEDLLDIGSLALLLFYVIKIIFHQGTLLSN